MHNELETGGKNSFFWRRVLAFWGDLLLIYLLTSVGVKAATLADIYLPFELTYLLLAAVYLTGSLYVWGATPAKAVYGLEVQNKGGVLRVLVRETVGKALYVTVALMVGGGVFFAVVSIRSLQHIPYALAIPIVLGPGAMICMAALQRKRAVHDLLTDTRVVNRPVIPRCEWVPNYVTREMFLRNKPFYQSYGAHFGREIRNADDVNTMFAEVP